jgi:hypothetical protein
MVYQGRACYYAHSLGALFDALFCHPSVSDRRYARTFATRVERQAFYSMDAPTVADAIYQQCYNMECSTHSDCADAQFHHMLGSNSDQCNRSRAAPRPIGNRASTLTPIIRYDHLDNPVHPYTSTGALQPTDAELLPDPWNPPATPRAFTYRRYADEEIINAADPVTHSPPDQPTDLDTGGDTPPPDFEQVRERITPVRAFAYVDDVLIMAPRGVPARPLAARWEHNELRFLGQQVTAAIAANPGFPSPPVVDTSAAYLQADPQANRNVYLVPPRTPPVRPRTPHIVFDSGATIRVDTRRTGPPNGGGPNSEGPDSAGV